MRYTIDYACISDRGKVRSVNQDNYYCLDAFAPRACERTNGILSGQTGTESGALFAIFDGMGGEQAGEDASYIAAKTANEFAKGQNTDFLRRLCQEADQRIAAFAEEHKLDACGSTAAMIYLLENEGQVCNLGDSRVYQVQNDRLIQLSEDHVAAVPGRKKPALVQYLGVSESGMAPEPHLLSLPLKRDDCFLICSDGLTDMVPEEEQARIIAQHASLADAVQALLDAALAAGGRDNTTVILVRVVSVRRQLGDFFPFSLFAAR